MLFVSSCFKDSFFCLQFSSVWLWYIWAWVFGDLSCLLESVSLCFSPNLGTFSHFYQIYFTTFYFFSSSSDLQWQILDLLVLSLISEVLFILFPMLCFFLCSDGIIALVKSFRFTDSFLCHLSILWLIPFSGFFILLIVSSNFCLFIDVAVLGLSCDPGDLCCVMWDLSLWHMDCTMQFCSFCLLVGYAQNPSS